MVIDAIFSGKLIRTVSDWKINMKNSIRLQEILIIIPETPWECFAISDETISELKRKELFGIFALAMLILSRHFKVSTFMQLEKSAIMLRM